MSVETHPLRPFLPRGAKVLVLGSFPPPRKRWCMEFFYPNWGNDFWRIVGLLASGDKDYFTLPGQKRFDQEKIERFCQERGIALYDTAEEVERLRDNASDNFLRVTRPTDIPRLLDLLPACRTIVATGQKSADTLLSLLGGGALAVGESRSVTLAGRELALWRVPSSSRAFPKPLAWKAAYYGKAFAGVIDRR